MSAAAGRAPAPDAPGRAIRWSTVAAVTAVALVAGWVSYQHAYRVVSSHGEAGLAAHLYPGTIDGLIYAASMALLDAARRGQPAPRLARWLLGAGISATLAANVLAGTAAGPLAAAVAAWPALALVGSYELLMVIIRGGAPAAAGANPPAAADPTAAVLAAYRASVAAGAPLSQRAMARQFGISRRRAALLAAAIAGQAEGYAAAA